MRSTTLFAFAALTLTASACTHSPVQGRETRPAPDQSQRTPQTLPQPRTQPQRAALPPAAAQSASELTEKFDQEIRHIRDGLELATHPEYARFYFGPEGMLRNFPMDSDARFFGGVTRAERLEFERKRSERRLPNPNPERDPSEAPPGLPNDLQYDPYYDAPESERSRGLGDD